MKKIINNTLSFFKSFKGLIIYIIINITFAYLLQSIDKTNIKQYTLTLCLAEITLLSVLILVFRKRIFKDFKDFDKNYKQYLSYGFKVWIIGLMVMALSNNIIYRFIDVAYNQQVNELIISKLPLYSIIAIVICGPFTEEIVFRLSFKEHIKNKYLYFLLTVLIFAGVHVFNGLTSPIELLYFIPYGSLAFAFSLILYKTDNIFTTVLIHTFHNSLAIVLLTLASILGA